MNGSFPATHLLTASGWDQTANYGPAKWTRTTRISCGGLVFSTGRAKIHSLACFSSTKLKDWASSNIPERLQCYISGMANYGAATLCPESTCRPAPCFTRKTLTWLCLLILQRVQL